MNAASDGNAWLPLPHQVLQNLPVLGINTIFIMRQTCVEIQLMVRNHCFGDHEPRVCSKDAFTSIFFLLPSSSSAKKRFDFVLT